MKFSPVLLLLLICACSSPADDAQTAYETAKSAYASSASLCEKARDVADLLAAEGDRDGFILWDTRSKNHCSDHRYGK